MKIPRFFSICCSPSVKYQSKPADASGTDKDANTTFRLFTYRELKSATRGFHSSDKIGEGGFGSVYKGRLRDGTFVAVKVLSIEVDSMQGEKEFVAELATLADVKHPNLVILRGCCVEGAHRYLVYQYMENNSLHHFFLGSKEGRMRFRGYLAPEYASSGQVTRKSDVYSFGVLLLEIVSGLAVVDTRQDRERFLVEKAWGAYEGDDLIRMVDGELNGEFPEEEAIRFLKVGLLCVQEDAKLRPKMTEALEMLSEEGENEIEGIRISRPGLVSDLRDIRIKDSSQGSTSSGAATYAPSIWSSTNLAR
ncbi:putative LRR receptor-like serine/threonine-protein kinase [Senna tora]|uniref:Putative LRR receptor-like serine/threonine-protein kinase n=1 Tax=Senna tora TaxID=362788 RepID=A0A834SIZ4_9FABA|nr:putative LRR receptor-like serine/threonine-protein kinase [Senna tora]